MAVTSIFHTQVPQERAVAEQAVFGHALTDADYADLGGNILEDAEVQVWFNYPWMAGGGESRIRIRVANTLATTNIRMNPDRFDYSECRVHAPSQKTGAHILRKIALTAKHHGIAVITGKGEKAANVEGILTSWGFYASPRMGFDAPIPPGTPPRPADLAACIRLSDLMATQVGRDFWKAHGVEVPSMTFDLADDSLSWNILTSYLAPPPEAEMALVVQEEEKQPPAQ